MCESEKIMIEFEKNITRISDNKKNFKVVMYIDLFYVGNDS